MIFEKYTSCKMKNICIQKMLFFCVPFCREKYFLFSSSLTFKVYAR